MFPCAKASLLLCDRHFRRERIADPASLTDFPKGDHWKQVIPPKTAYYQTCLSSWSGSLGWSCRISGFFSASARKTASETETATCTAREHNCKHTNQTFSSWYSWFSLWHSIVKPFSCLTSFSFLLPRCGATGWSGWFLETEEGEGIDFLECLGWDGKL